MIGTTLGSYRIVRELGKGGMGVVYYAEHPIIGKRAAVKVLRPELSENKEIVGRFFNEAKAATTINHPGLVDVYDFGYDAAGCAYIVMEFLDGESLAARLKRDKRLPIDFVTAMMRQLTGVLGAAHAHKIVHRDLKPDNIFLCPDPDVALGIRAKVLDFGIAKLAPSEVGPTESTPHTQTGVLMGTPLYMAPEQCRGAGAVDSRADIYALGVILFETLCGRVPFLAEGMGEIIAKHQYEPPPAPRLFASALPPHLESLILRMLEKQPDDRPQTMDEVAGLLDSRSRPRVVAETAIDTAPPRPVTPAASQPPDAKAATTLSSLTGAKPNLAPAHGKRGVVLGLAAVLVLAGGTTFYVVSRSSHAAIEPAPPRPPPQPATKVVLEIDSTPSGAEVYRASDGVRIGKTPLSKQFDRAEGQAVFLIKAAGYLDQTVELDTTADARRTVALEAVPHAPIDAAVDAPRPVVAKPPARPVAPVPTTPEAINPFEHPARPK